MKKVIKDKDQITVTDLVELLKSSKSIVVAYLTGSEPYYTFFNKLGLNSFGFRPPIFVYGTTYEKTTIRESIEAAIDAGKELLVIEREEMVKIFKY